MLLANVELPVLIVYVVMAIGFIVMIWGIQNLNKKSSGRIIMILGVLVFFGAFIASFMISGKKSEDKRLEKNAQKFLMAKAEKVASYIADRFPEEGSAAFLIDEDSYKNSESENYYLLSEIKRLLSEKGISCEDELIVGKSKQIVDKKTGEESIVTDDPTDVKIMQSTLKQINEKVSIVVNFVGLPSSITDLQDIKFLTPRKTVGMTKNNMILLTGNGLPFVPQDMLKSGRVCAVIDYARSEKVFDMQKDTVPKDLSEAFDMAYYFINPDTISEFIEENPAFFISK